MGGLLFFQGFLGVIDGEFVGMARGGTIVRITGEWAYVFGIACMALGIVICDLGSGMRLVNKYDQIGRAISKFVNKI